MGITRVSQADLRGPAGQNDGPSLSFPDRGRHQESQQ